MAGIEIGCREAYIGHFAQRRSFRDAMASEGERVKAAALETAIGTLARLPVS